MNEKSTRQIVSIRDLASIYAGYSVRPEERQSNGKYLLIGGRNLKDGRLITTERDSYINDIPKASFQRAIAQPGDIIVSILFDRRKLYIYRDNDPKGVVNSSCAIIRATQKNDYIVSYLRTLDGLTQFLHDAKGATNNTVIPTLTIAALSEIQIPLLPLSELERLGDDYIKSSSTVDLIALRNELQTKEVQINQLLAQLTQQNQTISYYEDRIRKIESQINTNDLESKIARGEGAKLEFKSSLRWNLKARQDDSKMELEILKTIAAFCNTEGGELLIGVADDGTTIGIEHDHFPSEDKFLLHLRNLITDKLIPKVVMYVNYEIVPLNDKKICHVVCKQSTEDVWVKKIDKTEVFYVRSGPSSTELSPRVAARYIREHFQK